MSIVPRHLSGRVQRALATSRVVNIVGPRQVGKTTLVRDIIPIGHYLTLDDGAVRRAMETDAFSQLSSLRSDVIPSLPVVIDEVQRVPEVGLALKRIVDTERQPGQFLLTGSADIFTYAKALDSLAGRVQTLTLRPLSAAEIHGAGPARILDSALDEKPMSALPKPVTYTRQEAIELMVRGGYPEIRGLEDPDRADRYASYLDSIVERDVEHLFPVRRPDNLRRMMDQLAYRTANELNISDLCSDIGIKHVTATTYMDALINLGVVHQLGAWASGRASREIKRPKIHMMDTGVATAVRGEDAHSYDLTADPTALGPVLETFVFNELEKSLPHQSQRWRLYHWRDQRGREIDIVAEAPRRRLALFEMKASADVVSSDFKHAEWFFGSDGPAKGYQGVAFVVYLGQHLLSFGPGKIALPLSVFWSYSAVD
nr:ATP-binding protein [Thalassobaculum litoreum]